MDRFSALLWFVLALLGFDGGGETLVHRTTVDGVDTLHSRATVQAGVARFECLRSASGRCHYVVLPQACAAQPGAADAGACASRPLRRFALDHGGSRQIAGLQAFRLCVSSEAGGRGCEAPERLAVR